MVRSGTGVIGKPLTELSYSIDSYYKSISNVDFQILKAVSSSISFFIFQYFNAIL